MQIRTQHCRTAVNVTRTSYLSILRNFALLEWNKKKKKKKSRRSKKKKLCNKIQHGLLHELCRNCSKYYIYRLLSSPNSLNSGTPDLTSVDFDFCFRESTVYGVPSGMLQHDNTGLRNS